MINLNVFVNKRKNIMFIIIYLISSYITYGQNITAVDSLFEILQVQKRDTLKVNTLNELAWELKKSDALKAKQFANQALRLSDSLKFDRGKITSLNRIGTIAIYQKDFSQAEKIYLDVLDSETKLNYKYGIGRAQNQLSEIYRNKNDLKKALKYGLEALSNFESTNNKKTVALISNNIGLIYQSEGLYDKSMKYFLKSLEIRELLKDEKNIGYNYLNIGILYLSLKNTKKAIEFFIKSEACLKKLDDQYELAKVYNNLGVAYFESNNNKYSLFYYTKALQLKTKMNIEEKDANIYNNLGAMYYKSGNKKLALRNYLKSIEIQKKNVDSSNLLNYSNIGHIYYSNEEYEKAIVFYKKALTNSKTSNNKSISLVVLNNLSLSYSKLKQYDLAYKYGSQYIKLKDSIENGYKNAVNLKEEYEQQKKEKELLSKDKKIALINLKISESENKKKSYMIYSLTGGLILLTLLFFAVIKGNSHKQKTLLAKKDVEIEKRKVEELLQKQELKSINAMIIGQEGERKRIARDLHDRLGSILSMVKIHFKSVEENIEMLKISNLKQYEKANELLDIACDEVRKISHDMASGVLNKFGLVAALEDLKEILEQSEKIEVEFIAHGLDDRLDNDVEIAIYRIVQELLSNVLKYAKATEISIQLLKGKNGINLIVEDNGVGFELNDEINGIGLKNIASRVDALEGLLNIDSAIGKGTTITVDILT